MKKFLPLMAAILLISTGVSYSVALTHKTYVFHCNSSEALCGGNLTKEYRPVKANFTEEGEVYVLEKDLNSSEINRLNENISRSENYYTVLASEKTLERSLPLRMGKSGPEIHEPSNNVLDGELDFYPMQTFEKEELASNSGCWRTDIKKVGGFYLMDWYKTYEPFYCLEIDSSFSGAPSRVINLNPLTWP